MLTGEEPPGSPERGLIDGFEGYLSPSDEDFRSVLTSGLVVLDTNVLMNLYRYDPRTRADLFKVLERLAESLWIPHQVKDEYWRGRELTVINRRNSANEAISALEKPTRQAEEIIATWARSVGLPEERHAELRQLIASAFDDLRAAIRGPGGRDPLADARDTNRDLVFAALEPLLAGRVGMPLPPDDLTKVLAEADRRASEEIPPGYKDRDKADHRGAGDYLVWEQTLREAERRHVDVLFVTSDAKEDWWRKMRGRPCGPRLELVAELRKRAGTRLFMLQPQDLLGIVGRLLQVTVQPESEAEIARTAQGSVGEGDGSRDRIRLYLATALTEALAGDVLSGDIKVCLGGSAGGSPWDVLVEAHGAAQAGVWIYDPVKPFNDLATDSVRSTAMVMAQNLRGDHPGLRGPWMACLVDLTSLTRGLSQESDHWQRGRHVESRFPALAEATFAPCVDQVIAAGFSSVVMLPGVDHATETDLGSFSRIDQIVDLIREHFTNARTSEN
ncbi:PIN-like domain-containing protein [Streptosporangium soli]|nr:PIN-like domain-containing protein [Streptosporangium sp. KLBMP 9127]